jgi:hypothetical protein
VWTLSDDRKARATTPHLYLELIVRAMYSRALCAGNDQCADRALIESRRAASISRTLYTMNGTGRIHTALHPPA